MWLRTQDSTLSFGRYFIWKEVVYCLYSINHYSLLLNCDIMYSVFLNPIFQQWQTCLSRGKKDDERKNISNSVFDLLHDHRDGLAQTALCECHSLSRVFPASHTTRLTFVTRLGKTSKHILSADGEHFRKFIRKLLGKMFQKHLKYIKF